MKLTNKEHLKVSEIFYSIQGEGTTTGSPAIFVRMALCNLSCGWCDTKFTWDWKNYDAEKEITLFTTDSLIQAIVDVTPKGHKPHVVFTGGEPLLQEDLLAPVWEKLIEMEYKWIEVETNGTIYPKNHQLPDQFNVSPKLENSGNNKKSRYKEDVLWKLNMKPNTCFKFVICDEADLKEVLEIVEKAELDKEKIMLMPEGVSAEEIKKKSKWLADVCMETGFQLCNRLQVAIWDDERKR